jgi:hypothetical protein
MIMVSVSPAGDEQPHKPPTLALRKLDSRWNTQQVISGPTRVIYTEQKQMMETILQFSRAL